VIIRKVWSAHDISQGLGKFRVGVEPLDDVVEELEMRDMVLGSFKKDSLAVLGSQPNSWPGIGRKDEIRLSLDGCLDNETKEIRLVLESSTLVHKPGMLGPKA
jgi:hypothetical protein